MELGMPFKFYINMAKGFRVPVRKFWGLIPTSVEVTGEKLVVTTDFAANLHLSTLAALFNSAFVA